MATNWAEYEKRLDAKKAKLFDRQSRWYKVEGGWIEAESFNEIRNLRGPNKWDGWEIMGRNFYLFAYTADGVELVDGQPKSKGAAYKIEKSTDKDEANNAFIALRQQLKEKLELDKEKVLRVRIILLADERTGRTIIMDDRKVPESKAAETLAKLQKKHHHDTSRALTYQVIDVDANEVLSSTTENPFWEELDS